MAGPIKIAILANAAQAQKTFDSTEKKVTSFGKRVSSAGDVMKGVLGANIIGKGIEVAGAAVQKFSGILGDSVSEARESQVVGATTTQIIKATGGAAKISADQVGDLAASISNKTGVDDEAIQSGSNLLLTFKNVRNEAGKGGKIFDRATQSAVDLSKAGFGSIEGSSKMLGKALNDPVKGISALGRAGVTFSDSQKKTIKSMVASGDVLGAQKIILKEVESQVGGVAAANATAGEKAAVMAGNLKEQFGTALLPLLDRSAKFFTSTLGPAISDGISKAGPIIDNVSDAVGGLLDIIFKGDYSGFGALGKAFGIAEDSPIVDFLFDVRDGLLQLPAAAATAFGVVSGSLGPALSGVFSGISGVVQTLVPIVAGIIGQVVGIIRAVAPLVLGVVQSVLGVVQVVGPIIGTILSTVLAAVQANMPAITSAFASIGSTLASIGQIITTVWTAIGPVVLPIITSVFGTIVTVISGAFTIVAGIFKTISAVLRGDWAGAWAGIKQIVSGAWTIIKALVVNGAAVVRGIMSAAISSVRGIWSAAWAGIKALVGIAWGAIKGYVSSGIAAVRGFVSSGMATVRNVMTTAWSLVRATVAAAWARIKAAIVTGVSSAVATVRSLPGKAKAALGNIGSLLVGAGRDLVRGFVAGIGDGIGWVVDKARSIATAAIRAAKAALDSHSPSREFIKIGKYVGQGFVIGLRGSQAQVQGAVTKMVGLLKKEAKAKGKAGARAKTALAVVNRLDGQALKIAGLRQVAATKLAAAQEKYNDLVKQRNDYAANVISSARQFASIGSITTQDNLPQTTENIVTGLKERLAAIQNYTGKLAALKARGLNTATYDQLVQLGIEQGTDYVDALFGGDAGVLKQVNSLQAQISSATSVLGNQTSDAMFRAGIQAQQGLLNGLIKDKASLERTATALAAALTAAVKKALKIKSPSRVFREIGQNTVAGLTLGLDSSQVAVQGRKMAGALESGFGSPALTSATDGGGGHTYLSVTLQVNPGATGAQVGAEFVKFVREYEKTTGRKVLAP